MERNQGRGGRPIERRPPPESWASVLVAWREAAGLTRAEMARRLGVAPPHVTRLESGGVEIGEKAVKRYAAALGKRARLELEDPDAPA